MGFSDADVGSRGRGGFAVSTDAAIASAPQRATSLQTNATTTVGNVTYMIHERGAKDGSCNGVGAFYNPRR
jgi:hypothetical protein